MNTKFLRQNSLSPIVRKRFVLVEFFVTGKKSIHTMHIHILALDVFQSRSRYMGQQLKGKRYEWDEKQMDKVKVSEYGVQHAAKLLL